jgi:glutathione S-transferase
MKTARDPRREERRDEHRGVAEHSVIIAQLARLATISLRSGGRVVSNVKMKLHVDPVGTGARAVMFYCAENEIPIEIVSVSLQKGEQQTPRFLALNPNGQVPLLEDGDFVLGETSSILKYIADANGARGYPRDAKKRARVNERMDWLNTGFTRDFLYDFVYPQVLPSSARSPEAVQAATIARGRERSKRWLDVLDRNHIGSNAYLCGDEITIADAMGAAIVSCGALIGLDFARWPNVARWMTTMRSLRAWPSTNEVFAGWCAALRGKTFVGLE